MDIAYSSKHIRPVTASISNSYHCFIDTFF